MDNEYEAFKATMRERFNKRFDKHSSILLQELPRDAYNANRALCFQWYLSGYFDALLGTEDGEGLAAMEDAANGRTKPFSEIRKTLKTKREDERVM